MTRSSDDNVNMTNSFLDRRNGLDDRTLDELLGADSRPESAQFEGVAVLLTDLRTLIDVPAPPPTSELAEMMALGLPATSGNLTPILGARRAARQRLRRTGLALGLSAAMGLPLAGLAAAKDLLPNLMDDAITTVIEAITPFHLSDIATGIEDDPGSGLGEGRAEVVRERQGSSTPPVQRRGGAASEGTGTSPQSSTPTDSALTGATTATSNQAGGETTLPGTSPGPTQSTTSRAPGATTGPVPTTTTSAVPLDPVARASVTAPTANAMAPGVAP